MRVGIVGVGAVGTRVIRRLLAAPDLEVVVDARRMSRDNNPLTAFGNQITLLDAEFDRIKFEAVVVATPAGLQAPTVAPLLGRCPLIVTTGDELSEVRDLLSESSAAVSGGSAVVVGAAFAPGLSCVLAWSAGHRMDEVHEVHVAKVGTGGPACARQHHRALGGWALDWRDGHWIDRPGGSGRELCWFPEGIGSRDCYVGELADPLLMVEAFPDVKRVTARLAANRRDRFTAWLPMMTPPHSEGALGAIRVEVRGMREGESATEVLGVSERPAVAAAALAASVVLTGVAEPIPPGTHAVGAIASAELVDELLSAGIRFHRFSGTEIV